MGFRSQLDSIVRFRRLLEERQEAKLRSAQLKLSDSERSLETNLQLERALVGYAVSLTGAFSSTDLHVVEMRRQMVAEMLSILRNRHSNLSKEAGAEYEKLMKARQEREKVETIRDSAKASWVRQRARKEQLWLDEIFLVRRR